MSGNLTARRPFTQRGNMKPQTLPAILLVLVLVLETIQKNENEDETTSSRRERKGEITPGSNQFEPTAVCCSRAMSRSARGSVSVLPVVK